MGIKVWHNMFEMYMFEITNLTPPPQEKSAFVASAKTTTCNKMLSNYKWFNKIQTYAHIQNWVDFVDLGKQTHRMDYKNASQEPF